MGIFNSFANLFKSKPRAGIRVEPVARLVKDFSLSTPYPLFGFGNIYPSNTGVPVTPYTSLQHPVFYSGVKALADDLARMDLLFENKVKDGWQLAEEHAVLDLLRRPNSYQTSFNMWHYTITSLKIWGNAYIYIQRDPVTAKPIRLIPLIPSSCSMLITQEFEVRYSFTHPLIPVYDDGRLVDAMDMLHFKDMSLDGGLRGLSAPAISQDALGTAIAARTHSASMFRDGTLLQGLLSTPGKLSTEGAARMAESWKQAHTGATNAHKVAVLEEDLKYQPMQQTAEEALLGDFFRLGNEDAARILRLPQHKVGILDKATFSNIEQQNLNYLQDALLPIARNIEAELATKLLLIREQSEYRFRWDFSSLLQADTTAQFAAYEKAFINGFMTTNEIRAKMGLPPDPDGDKLRVPLNTAPLGSLRDEPLGKPEEPKPAGLSEPEPEEAPPSAIDTPDA